MGYGITYVLFYWSPINPLNSIPVVLYPFMDTSTGLIHTICLLGQLFVLVFFHGIFAALGWLVAQEIKEGDTEKDTLKSIGVHVLIFVLLCCLTCRFRD